jgi:RNA polymerase sigma-70 factor (ECF subfamily)
LDVAFPQEAESDAALALAAREGSQAAFRELVRRFERKLASWLLKIAHNTAIDHLRRRGLDTVSLSTGEEGPDEDHRQIAADPHRESPEAKAQRHEMARGLERALAQLRPEYRSVLLLRFHQGLAYEEIAEVTGLPLGTVKTHLHRGRQELAQRMGRLGWRVGGEP